MVKNIERKNYYDVNEICIIFNESHNSIRRQLRDGIYKTAKKQGKWNKWYVKKEEIVKIYGGTKEQITKEDLDKMIIKASNKESFLSGKTISIKETKNLLNLCNNTLYRYLKRGIIEGKRNSLGHYEVSQKSVLGFLENKAKIKNNYFTVSQLKKIFAVSTIIEKLKDNLFKTAYQTKNTNRWLVKKSEVLEFINEKCNDTYNLEDLYRIIDNNDKYIYIANAKNILNVPEEFIYKKINEGLISGISLPTGEHMVSKLDILSLKNGSSENQSKKNNFRNLIMDDSIN